MSIIRTEHNKANPYVILNKSALEDPSLSWAAKGLWAYLMSRPDNWTVSVTHLSTIYSEKGGGEKAIYSLLKELIKNGYCKRSQSLNEKGQFEKYDYVITEFKNILPDSPQPHAAEPHAGEGPPNKYRDIPNKEDDDDRVRARKEEKENDQTLRKDDIHAACMRLKKDWTFEEIEEAWNRLEKHSAPAMISDPIAYIEETIRKMRIISQNKKQKESPCNQKKTNKKEEKAQSEKSKGFYSENDTWESPLAKSARQNGLRC